MRCGKATQKVENWVLCGRYGSPSHCK